MSKQDECLFNLAVLDLDMFFRLTVTLASLDEAELDLNLAIASW